MKISNYRFGRIEIDGQGYGSDVIITPERVIDHWWRKNGHSLAIEDLDAVIHAEPEMLILGSGYFGRMRVPETTLAFLDGKGIQVQIARTADAVRSFNALQRRHARIVAALHLSC